MLNILQVCNVGSIVGGTAACAWTVTRSLPDCAHTVAFLGRISDETEQAFAHCRLLQWNRVEASAVDGINPDIVLLHNTRPRHLDAPLPFVTVQYRHSRSAPAEAGLTVYCSRWLAEACRAGADRVCYQAVPRPARGNDSTGTRALRSEPVIGRLCTPVPRKWPPETVEFYRLLSRDHPRVRWEFVGCPADLQHPLKEACRGRAAFLEPSWNVRGRLWHWDALLYHNPHVTESFGRTVAEAMRCGCIPIVDDRGGFGEQIADGCGFLCRDREDFSQGVERIHCAGFRWRLSQRCQAHADQRFSLSRFRNELLRWFRRAAAEQARDA